MKILRDSALLRRYAEENALQDRFSFWEQYNVSLVRYSRGEYISLYDQPSGMLCLICRGTVKVTYITEGGREIYVASGGPGTMLGDMEYAGAVDADSSLNISAMTETDCICIPFSTNRSRLDNDVIFLRAIIRALVTKTRSNVQMLYAERRTSIESKVAAFAQRSAEADGVLRPSWTAVAELLRVSYRQVMRVLGKFCEEGVMARGGKQGEYRVMDRKRLGEIAGETRYDYH